VNFYNDGGRYLDEHAFAAAWLHKVGLHLLPSLPPYFPPETRTFYPSPLCRRRASRLTSTKRPLCTTSAATYRGDATFTHSPTPPSLPPSQATGQQTYFDNATALYNKCCCNQAKKANHPSFPSSLPPFLPPSFIRTKPGDRPTNLP